MTAYERIRRIRAAAEMADAAERNAIRATGDDARETFWQEYGLACESLLDLILSEEGQRALDVVQAVVAPPLPRGVAEVAA